MVLYTMDGVEYMDLAAGDSMVKGLWIRIKEQTKKADVIVGVHCRPPTQDDDTECSLSSTSKSTAFVPMGDFNEPDINLEYHRHVKTTKILLTIVGRKSVTFRKRECSSSRGWLDTGTEFPGKWSQHQA